MTLAALDEPLAAAAAASPRPQPCPPPSEDGLAFKRQPMTDWLRPRQLATTGVKALLASLFGAYADKRELQAALFPPDSGSCYDADYSQEAEDFWFDYVADLGDGFNPTYAIAWLLSRPSLALPGLKEPLPRGGLLVLGGDQVYPTATRDEYQNRFRGPYQAAFSSPPAGARPPEMFALPGNHDWYDGLTSFSRLFCQERSIGGWKTRQRRSYFALKLPHNWWLWGTDFQLDADIDFPQLKYFDRVAKRMRLEARDAGAGRPRLILCTAKPSWVHCGVDEAKADEFANLAFFEERVIRANGLRLATVIAGDLHHYTRYEEAPASPEEADVGQSARAPATGRTQRITAGGGGAYLYPTHQLPRVLEVSEGRRNVRYRRKAAFPRAADSRRLAPRCLYVPFRNRWFTGFLGSVYLLLAWMFQSVSRPSNDLFRGSSLMEFLSEHAVPESARVVQAFFDVIKHSPSSVALVALVLLGLTAYRASEGPKVRRFWGMLHGSFHLLLGCGLMWLFSWLNLRVLGLGVDEPWQFLLFSLEMLAVGGTLGGLLFTLYLLLSSTLTSCHTNDVYSSQAIEGYKNFLRLRIDRNGRLTLYPVGVEHVPGTWDWRYRPEAKPGDPWFDPPSGALRAELIEGPVRTL